MQDACADVVLRLALHSCTCHSCPYLAVLQAPFNTFYLGASSCRQQDDWHLVLTPENTRCRTDLTALPGAARWTLMQQGPRLPVIKAAPRRYDSISTLARAHLRRIALTACMADCDAASSSFGLNCNCRRSEIPMFCGLSTHPSCCSIMIVCCIINHDCTWTYQLCIDVHGELSFLRLGGRTVSPGVSSCL